MFAIGNTLSNFYVKKVLCEWRSRGAIIVINLYSNFNTPGNVVKYKKYTDYEYVYHENVILDMYDRGFVSLYLNLLHNIIYERQLLPYGVTLNGNLTTIRDSINYAHSRILVCSMTLRNDELIQTTLRNDELIQTSSISLGFKVKYLTILLRQNRVILSNTTYIVRFECRNKIVISQVYDSLLDFSESENSIICKDNARIRIGG